MEETGTETPQANGANAGVELSDEQRAVLQRVLSGENVFFTGGAGTGKSVLLRAIVDALMDRGRRCAVTATTGVAAINVSGETYHRFMGIGLGEGPEREFVARMQIPQQKQKILDTDVLLIDEISMMRPEMFDKLDGALKKVRGDWRPYGGIQLVLVGDFFQLPPVPPDGTPRGTPARHCFQAKSWEHCVPNTYELTRIYRQQSDPVFASILQEIRRGRCDASAQRALEACIRPTPSSPWDRITELYTTNKMVDAKNDVELAKLSGEERTYEAESWGDEKDVKVFEKHCLAPKVLRLKVDALVMLVANLDVQGGLANGSTGIVIGFSREETVKTRLPVVRFSNGRELGVGPHSWEKKRVTRRTVETRDGETVDILEETVVASYTQVPLKLAWAVTVHKSQGCSLDRAKVVLDKVWESGQVYVALSRLRTRDGLYLDRFRASDVHADPAVMAFHEGGGLEGEKKRPSTISDYFVPKKKNCIGEA